MLDSYNRSINYLRISVTDRCNLRCEYCMPADGIKLLKHEDILRFEEIFEVVQEAVKVGITKVRFTGGEPLVRRGIISLIREVGKIPQLKDLSITTNGILLDKYAHELYEAGIKRINISLDTVNAEKYSKITFGGNIQDVFRGIEAAREAGLDPIKINCVVDKSSQEQDAEEVLHYCNQNGLIVRFITKMNLSSGHFSVVDGGSGGNCSVCNRLRLTANGKIKPCLFDDIEFDVRALGAHKAIHEAIRCKPACGSVSNNNLFHNIGG